MKFFLLLLSIYFFHVCICNSINTQIKLDTKANENCLNPCLACQNTLYFLKFKGNSECRQNMCPGLCISLSNQWNSGRNTHMNFFKLDQINICESCFRSKHCHINDCILEKTIIHNAIQHATQNIALHSINPNAAVFNLINKRSDDFYFNMDFVFKNLDKIINLLNHYEKVYHDSLILKKYYKILIKYISEKSSLNLNEFNLGMDVDLDENVFTKWEDIVDHVRIYKHYYMSLKSNKIHLNEEKIYLSTEIRKEEDSIKNILDFDNKVKFNLNKAHNITELYKLKCHQNLIILKKFVVFVEIINSRNINKEEKLKMISSGIIYSDDELKVILAPRKINTTVVKNISNNTQLNKTHLNNNEEKIISIKVAGKLIKLENNNKILRSSNMNLNNQTNSTNKEISENEIIDIFNEKEEEDEEKEDDDKIGKRSKINKNNKEKIRESRIIEPSLGSQPSESTLVQENKILDESNKKKITNDEQFKNNKNVNSQSNLRLNDVKNNNKTDNSNSLNTSSVENPLPTVSEITITTPDRIKLSPQIIPITSGQPINPPLLIGQPIPIPMHPGQTPMGGNFPLPSSQIPISLINSPPILAKITAVKIESPNETFNKNIFKPDPKIDTLAKNILGIDPRPQLNNPINKLPVLSLTGVQNLQKIYNRNNATFLLENTNTSDSIITSFNSNSDNSTNRKSIFDKDDLRENDTPQSNTNKESPPILENIPTPSTSLPTPISSPHNLNLHHRKEDDSETDNESLDDLYGGDDEHEELGAEDTKSFLQKNTYSAIPEINLSDLKNIVRNNKIKKKSVDEIKNSAKKFMMRLKNKVEEYRVEKKNEDDKENKDEEEDSLFIQRSDNKSLGLINRTSNNLVNLFSDNLKNLDDEFFEIKHKIIMNLTK